MLNMVFLNIIDEAFESLFFGTGMWLGLILFIILAVSVSIKVKYVGFLITCIIIFMGAEYGKRFNISGEVQHAYGLVILFLTAIVILIVTIEGTKEES
jgi:hypothetical protein